MKYTLNGMEHELSCEERNAVNRSGRSSWQDYRRYPTQWPQQHVQVIALMERRPGAVEPGERPRELPEVPERETQFVTVAEKAFILRMGHMTDRCLGHAMGRTTECVRRIRLQNDIRVLKHKWNTERERREAREAWLVYAGT